MINIISNFFYENQFLVRRDSSL